MGKVAAFVLSGALALSLAAGCSRLMSSAKPRQPEPALAPAVNAEPQSPQRQKPQLIPERSFLESVAAIEKEDPALRGVVGYSTPGSPVRLPAKVIQIYVAPYTTPLGRLVGEHFVYAVVQPESWWTPGTIGFDAIVPPDVVNSSAREEGVRQGSSAGEGALR